MIVGSAHVAYSTPAENADSVSANSWTLLVEASVGGVFDSSATFGVRPDATSDFDPAYDQPSPPHPPGNWVQAYFPHTGGNWPTLLGNRFAVDVMQPDSAAWNMDVESSFDTGSVALSWDTTGMSALPATYAILMRDSAAHVTLNMRLRRSYTFFYSGVRAFSIAVRTAADVTSFTVGAKWNIVSVPRIPADSSALALFPGAVSLAFAFDGAYLPKALLQNGAGYWLKFDAAGDIEISGASLPALAIPVQQGWNLIGALDHPVPAPAGGVIGSQFFGYAGHYVTADTLYPAMGYWVKATGSGTIPLGGPGAAPRTASGVSGTAIPVTVTGADGSAQTVYLVPSGSFGAASYELPPVPPSEAFDVRFSSQRYAEEYDPAAPEGRPRVLLIQAAQTPILLTTGRTTPQLEASVDGISWKALPVTLRHNGQVRLRFAAAAQPSAFRLEQNYPNPFNPSTVIRYTLPERSAIRLTIVTLLGQTVSVLADGPQEAGAREIVLDTRQLDLPSGSYWYRLTGTGLETGRTFSDAKKLILMK